MVVGTEALDDVPPVVDRPNKFDELFEAVSVAGVGPYNLDVVDDRVGRWEFTEFGERGIDEGGREGCRRTSKCESSWKGMNKGVGSSRGC